MIDDEPQSVTAGEATPAAPLAKTLLALNNAYAAQLSWLEPERLQHLVGQAFLARRIGNLDASCSRWIRTPITTARTFSGFAAATSDLSMSTGSWSLHRRRAAAYARRLYQDLFEHAVRSGHQQVFCEVNSSPSNPQSDAFHAALGFAEVGSASIPDGRTVRYLSRQLATPSAI
jgi:predicted GNAT superfamily acetyltransferase